MLSKDDLRKIDSLPDSLQDSEEERQALLWLIQKLKESQAEILTTQGVVFDLVAHMQKMVDIASMATRNANAQFAINSDDNQVEVI